MATYTMQLKAYIEMFSQDQEDLNYNERIEIGRPKLFNFYYPIFDEAYRKVFETNFIKNFYIREIGFETEGLFKMRLDTWLNINMPYFNELFKSELIEYDPLINTTMTTAHDKLNEKQRQDLRDTTQDSLTDGKSDSKTVQSGTSKDDSTTTDTSGTTTNLSVDEFGRVVSSDNPDSRLQLQTQAGKGVIEYASKIDEDKKDSVEQGSSDSTSNSTVSATGSNTRDTDSTDKSLVTSNSNQLDNLNRSEDDREHYIERRLGKVGMDSQSKLIQDYRNALMRVEVQIHKEMQELFMMVY